MKPVRLATVVLFALSSLAVADMAWPQSLELGEDATSSTDYFYQAPHGKIRKVRQVWNGGAQRPPEVVDYEIDPGRVTVTCSKGNRESIPDLIAGKEAKLEQTDQFTINLNAGTGPMIAAAHDTPAGEGRGKIAMNLIEILAQRRNPLPGIELLKR